MRRDRRYNYGTPAATGFERLVVTNTEAIGFQQLPPPASSEHAIIHVTEAAIRWRADADPTATIGILLEAESYWDMMEYDLNWSVLFQHIRFISLGAQSVLEAQFFD